MKLWHIHIQLLQSKTLTLQKDLFAVLESMDGHKNLQSKTDYKESDI